MTAALPFLIEDFMRTAFRTSSHWKYAAIALGVALASLASDSGHAQQPSKSAVEKAVASFMDLLQQGRDAEAAAVGDKMLGLLKRDKNTSEIELGMLAATVARTHHGAGSYVKAHETFDYAEVLLKRALDKIDKSDQAYPTLEWFYYGAIKNNGDALLRSGRVKDAEKKYQRVVDDLAGKYGEDNDNVLTALAGLADVAIDGGRLDEAAGLFARVCGKYEERHKAGDPTLSNCLNNLARLHTLRGDYSQAEQAFEKALAIRDPSGTSNDTQIATYLVNLAELKGMRARFREAEVLLRRAVVIIETNAGPNHPGLAMALNGLAVQLTRQERYGEAEPLARRALAIMARSDSKATLDGLVVSVNLALILSFTEKSSESEALYRQVIETGERDPAFRQSNYMAAAYGNLGSLFERQGRYAAAGELYAKVRVLQIQRLGPRHRDVAMALNNLGRAAQLQGKAKEAEKFYQESLAIKGETLDANHPSLALTHANLGDLYRAQRHWPEALASFKQAAAIARDYDRINLLADSQGETGERKSHGAFPALAQAAWHVSQNERQPSSLLFAEAFEAMQLATDHSAARAMAQMSARFAKGEQVVSALVRQRQDIVSEVTALEQNLLASLAVAKADRRTEQEKTSRDRMQKLKSQLGALDTKLDSSFPEYVQLTRPKPAQLADVQAVLGPSEALVAYLFVDQEAFAWLVTKDRQHWVRLALPSAAIAEKTQLLRCGLDYQGSWSTAAGADRCKKLLQVQYVPAETDVLPFNASEAHGLYHVLLKPFEDLIKDKHLFIVPTGSLTSIPFQVLIYERSQGKPEVPASLEEYRELAWLWRRHAVTVLPSVGSLRALRALTRTAAAQPYTGFGNPLLVGPNGTDRRAWQKQSCSQTPTKLQQRASARAPAAQHVAKLMRGGAALVEEVRRQSPLPETADELCAVANYLGARNSDVHLGSGATETNLKTLSENGTLGRSRVIHFATHGLLAGETEQMAKELAEPALIMTPPSKGDDKDDGLLSASEIAQLKLNADWVIMSACNTAAGASTGAEALSGLAKAFIYAGARSLLVSHWYVSSSATVDLVTTALSEMTREPRIGNAEGLRRAMSALVAKGHLEDAHPTNWAPFVVVGEAAAAR